MEKKMTSIILSEKDFSNIEKIKEFYGFNNMSEAIRFALKELAKKIKRKGE